jgi:hypothetical protein
MAAINPRDKQRQRALDDALQLRLSARFERRMRSEIASTMLQAAADYAQRGELAIPLAIADHNKAMSAALSQHYRYIAEHFGGRLLSEAKHFGGPDVTKASLSEMLRSYIADFLWEWTATKVTWISQTTESQIRGIIRGGLSDGLGVNAIADQIRDLSAPFSALRAHVIARTETHTAASFGSQQAAELTGIDMKREWVSAMDGRTRDTADANHKAADGQIRGMKEPFIVSGERLMYPGDPAGSASNTIMCRCSIAYLYD